MSGNVGSMQASTSSYSGSGVHHYSVQAELRGPHVGYELQKTHADRLHGSVTGGAVAGAAAQAGGKPGLENGFLRHSADVNAVAGVGTHVKADVAVDLRHYLKPGIAAGLRPALAGATSVASPASTIEPEKSRVEKFLAKALHARRAAATIPAASTLRSPAISLGCWAISLPSCPHVPLRRPRGASPESCVVGSEGGRGGKLLGCIESSACGSG
ncbi:hypothetical protein [Myxococcus sp. AB036A]|uniref:hypothetical protein n=1 Tax=Myxococcus sp. AB036A TaxID=2562793 RepID=UPI001E46CF44|nr:hypothetical protein [Myxococcus sp. AB036A]